MSEGDWDALLAAVRERLDRLRTELGQPFPVGEMRFFLGFDDRGWLVEQISLANHYCGVLRRGGHPQVVRTAFKADIEAWCAMVSGELLRRRRVEALLGAIRGLGVALLVVLLIVSVELLLEEGFLGLVTGQLAELFSQGGAASLTTALVAGILSSIAVAVALAWLGRRHPWFAGLLRLLLWSPATLIGILLAGGLVSFEAAPPQPIQDAVAVVVRPGRLAFLLGYALPIMLHGLRQAGELAKFRHQAQGRAAGHGREGFRQLLRLAFPRLAPAPAGGRGGSPPPPTPETPPSPHPPTGSAP